MLHSVQSIQTIYNKAYAHPGLMGTHFDRKYLMSTEKHKGMTGVSC